MAESAKTTLPKSVFAVEVVNHQLLKLAYEAYLANGRPNLAKTLRRGEVSGGGRKPHRQKGTGRARAGSIRSPLWRKGGITFGPLGNENYTKKVPTGAKRVALRQALTLAAQANEVMIIDDITATGKTKDMTTLLQKHGYQASRKTVLVVESKAPELIRATNNLPDIELVQATYLNVFTILNADTLMITKSALKAIEAWLGGSK
jgi:large subunit ribosomal protein L4